MERASQIGKFSDRDKIWDMVVVGGGATGLGVAVVQGMMPGLVNRSANASPM